MLITACHCALCHCYSSQLGISHQNLVEKNVWTTSQHPHPVHQVRETRLPSMSPWTLVLADVRAGQELDAHLKPPPLGEHSEARARSVGIQLNHWPPETSEIAKHQISMTAIVHPQWGLNTSAVFALQWVLLLHSWVVPTKDKYNAPVGVGFYKGHTAVALQPLSDS